MASSKEDRSAKARARYWADPEPRRAYSRAYSSAPLYKAVKNALARDPAVREAQRRLDKITGAWTRKVACHLRRDRERWKTDPEYRKKKNAKRARKNKRQWRDDPVWRAKKAEKERLRRLRKALDPKWVARRKEIQRESRARSRGPLPIIIESHPRDYLDESLFIDPQTHERVSKAELSRRRNQRAAERQARSRAGSNER